MPNSRWPLSLSAAISVLEALVGARCGVITIEETQQVLRILRRANQPVRARAWR